MRTLSLALLLIFTTPVARAGTTRAERRAMMTVVAAAWPRGDARAHKRLVELLAQDYAGLDHHRHHDVTFNDANRVAETLELIHALKGTGIPPSDQDIRDFLVALIDAYQVAATDSYDESAHVTARAGTALTVLSAAGMLGGMVGMAAAAPFAAPLLIAGSLTMTPAALTSLIYKATANDPVAKKLPVFPGSRWLAKRVANNDRFRLFWKVVHTKLARVPELQALGPQPENSPAVNLERTLALVRNRIPGFSFNHLCAEMLVAPPATRDSVRLVRTGDSFRE